MAEAWDRRELIKAAAALGAGLALPRSGRAEPVRLQERSDLFPEGVASADPDSSSVILWTRRPPAGQPSSRLIVQVSEDPRFRKLAASGSARVSADADWTCRFLAAGLQPDRAYWYRFVDEQGNASRTGRTFTAPADTADARLRFAFVSCQNVNLGYSTPYRRMIAEDIARSDADQLRFVLHLGDFIYEMVWYPEDRPDGLQGRPVRDTVRLPAGRRNGDYHIPSGVEDYRAIYRAYLADPDLQDARARWPFICVWDNHEFSNRGWQSQAVYEQGHPAQRLKVAANQAWFEYIPARVRQPGREAALDAFHAPDVEERPLDAFDEQGLSREPNNLCAINSLLIARSLRWGRHVELVLTDNRSFRSQPVIESEAAGPFRSTGVPYFLAQDVIEILDAGRTYGDGRPPATITFGGNELPNPRRNAAPGSMLGADQKRWFLDRVAQSDATWTLWGNSVGMLDLRCDPANLPAAAAKWPTSGHGVMSGHDWSGYPAEGAELLQAAAKAGTRLVSIVGDRHAFYAGVISPTLPPKEFTPVAAEFVVGSICTPTVAEAAAAALPAEHPLGGLIVEPTADRAAARPTLNVTLRHGVKAAAAVARGVPLKAALALRNPDVAPHLSFADAAGHGFATVSVDGERIDVEFVAMAAPVSADTDRVLYCVTHRLQRWERGGRPSIRQMRAEGSALADRYLDEPRA